jgi:hypothetical protein
MDADALRSLQQARQGSLDLAADLDVPDAARETNVALVQAFQYAVTSDGNWARYADGEISRAEVSAYDEGNTGPAKLKFNTLFNELREGIPDAPPPLDPDFLF